MNTNRNQRRAEPSARNRMRLPIGRRLRALIAALAIFVGTAGVAISGAAPAAAAQSFTLRSSESWTFGTWFFGRTTICVNNPNSSTWLISADNILTGFWWQTWLAPHSTACFTRSFVGLGVEVTAFDSDQNAPVGWTVNAYLPIGP